MDEASEFESILSTAYSKEVFQNYVIWATVEYII